MKKYEVTVDYVMSATLVVEARNEESALSKVGKYVHTRKGFDEYVKFAAPMNVDWREHECCGADGFDITFIDEFDGESGEGHIDIGR